MSATRARASTSLVEPSSPCSTDVVVSTNIQACCVFFFLGGGLVVAMQSISLSATCTYVRKPGFVLILDRGVSVKPTIEPDFVAEIRDCI